MVVVNRTPSTLKVQIGILLATKFCTQRQKSINQRLGLAHFYKKYNSRHLQISCELCIRVKCNLSCSSK